MKKKQIVILGSTGSIGTQALKVIEEHPDLYEAYALTANNQVELLVEQARKFMPAAVVIANEAKYLQLKEMLADLPIQVYAGADALCEIVEAKSIDVVLASMVGYAGLRPTMNAIRAGKTIALANKETLVAGGNDAGAIQTACGGVRVCAISLPCRYLHSESCVISKQDFENSYKLTKLLSDRIFSL